jgi:hypothetical protein
MRVHDLDTSTGSTFFENANARIELRARLPCLWRL